MEANKISVQDPYHQKVIEAHLVHFSLKKKLWLNTLLIAAALYAILAYITFLLDKSLEPLTFSKALGGTAAICLAISFSFSSWCYYFNFLDHKLIYRKYFGLTGYYIAILYSFSLLFVNSERYFFGFFENIFSADFILGLSALAYFTFMAVISNSWAIKQMSPKHWRWALRGGFAAWFLLAVRAFILEKPLWLDYLSTFRGFPPPRMLLSLLVVAVITFRLSIEVSKKLRNKNKQTLSLPT